MEINEEGVKEALKAFNNYISKKAEHGDTAHHINTMRAAIMAYEESLWKPIDDIINYRGVPVLARTIDGNVSLVRYLDPSIHTIKNHKDWCLSVISSPLTFLNIKRFVAFKVV